MPETSKTKTVALFVIIGSALFLGTGLIGLFMLVAQPDIFSLYLLSSSVLSIGLGILGFVVASALHKLKRWAFIVASVEFSVSLLFNLIKAISGRGDLSLGLAILIDALIVVLLYLDRNTFFSSEPRV